MNSRILRHCSCIGLQGSRFVCKRFSYHEPFAHSCTRCKIANCSADTERHMTSCKGRCHWACSSRWSEDLEPSSIFIYFLLQEQPCWCCEHLTCDSQSNSRVSVIKKRVVGCCEAQTKISRVTLCQVPDCQSAHLVRTSVRHAAWKLRDICQVLMSLIIW